MGGKKFSSEMNSRRINLLEALVIFSVVLFSVLFIYIGQNGYNIFLTGFATSATNATVNLTVQSVIQINFTTGSLSFGQGRVSAGASNGTLDSSINGVNNVTNGTWPGNVTGLRIQNIGNKNVTLFVGFGKNASGFLGGTAPSYKFNVSNSLAGSCNNTFGYVSLGANNEVNATFIYNATWDGAYVCSNFSYSTANNIVRLDIRLVVPSDSNNGSLGDIITASAGLSAN